MATTVKPRRTQAERSAETRGRIIEAAIASLCEDGYGATTTVHVAKLAGVSRGAMLHHFPTKEDLIFATADEVVRRNRAALREMLEDIDDPRERFERLPELRWSRAMRPAGIALVEILSGARSDKTVREGFLKFREKMVAERAEWVKQRARDAGLPFDERQLAVSRAISFAIRGMTIEQQLDPDFDAEPIVEALKLMKLNAVEEAAD